MRRLARVVAPRGAFAVNNSVLRVCLGFERFFILLSVLFLFLFFVFLPFLVLFFVS